MTPEDPDLPAVQALQAGNDQALTPLMDRHQDGLFRFIYRQTSNEADALDLTMESFVRAYFNIGKFRPTARFKTWLYRIALNLCRDHLRSRAYRYSLQTDSFDASGEESGGAFAVWFTDDTPARRTGCNEELVALTNAINELPTDLKNAFVLRTLEDRPEAEAAELLGLSRKAVGARVNRARRLLLSKMSEMGF
jgi:RNA polymerase sigma-70 factor (ECF subfamily)